METLSTLAMTSVSGLQGAISEADNSFMPVLHQAGASPLGGPAARARPDWPPSATLVDIEVAPHVRPLWVSEETRLRVPVPNATPRHLCEGNEVVVWACIEEQRRFPLATRGDGGLLLAYSWEEWSRHILTERYASWRRRPLYTRLPISYQIVPASLRHRLAMKMCQSRQSASKLARQCLSFPFAPFEGGYEALRYVLRSFGHPGVVDPPPARICLTHDVDTEAGFRSVRQIAKIESDLGLRSSWNIVVGEYAIDTKVLDWLIERGFEIGLHDYLHDNKLIYLREPELRKRLDRCRTFINHWHVQGFRSPSWFRTPALMRVLRDYVRYDCSCLDFDWLCPAGRGGVLTPSPFVLEGLVELPTTIPFEAPLLDGCDPALIPTYWQSKVEWLLALASQPAGGGQAVVNSHPDPHYCGQPDMMKAYERFLEDLSTHYQGKWALPRDLAAEVAGDA